MFSVSPAEILTILVIALIIFGPRRLSQMARQAGKVAGDLRRTADELRSGIQEEIEEVTKPINDLRSDLAAAGKSLVESAEGELKWVDTPPDPSRSHPPDAAESETQAESPAAGPPPSRPRPATRWVTDEPEPLGAPSERPDDKERPEAVG